MDFSTILKMMVATVQKSDPYKVLSEAIKTIVI